VEARLERRAAPGFLEYEIVRWLVAPETLSLGGHVVGLQRNASGTAKYFA
jgi:hypothetical protein